MPQCTFAPIKSTTSNAHSPQVVLKRNDFWKSLTPSPKHTQTNRRTHAHTHIYLQHISPMLDMKKHRSYWVIGHHCIATTASCSRRHTNSSTCSSSTKKHRSYWVIRHHCAARTVSCLRRFTNSSVPFFPWFLFLGNFFSPPAVNGWRKIYVSQNQNQNMGGSGSGWATTRRNSPNESDILPETNIKKWRSD